MIAMGEMVGHIAHQWRQPLSSISTSATGMKLPKELNILEDVFLIQGLEQINKSVQYLSETIDDFRNFYNPNKNKSEFKILDTIDKVINLINSQFMSNGIKVITSGDNLKINTYENELIQIIINLLNNARDELIKKDIEHEKLIFINVLKEEKNIVIEIKDNANGIPEKIKNKIFNAYFTTKKDTQGTGIGLYMSRQIVENMDGKIEVSNDNYEFKGENYTGASFRIIIPLS